MTKVIVRNGNVDGALRMVKQRNAKDGLLKAVRERQEGYMKPGVKKRLAKKEAIKNAKKYLYDRGFTSLKQSYYEKTDNIATVNFAYEQSGIICYSDLIKVKVALDNGEILGIEANGYIMNHKHRTFPEIKISEDEAKSKINSHLNVTSSSLAMIPKDSKREVLCYEFKGNHKGKNFLIYINVENGYEEEILMLIESEDGILTV